MLKFLLPVILLAALVGVTVVTDKAPPPADFTFINRGDVKTLDPQRMSWMQDLRVARLVYEPLVRLDVLHEDYPPIPGVARNWEISEDRLTYTFYLRDDAKWSNGEPVRASDFVYAWRRAMLPDTGSDYQKLFMLIEGAAEWAKWRQTATAEYASRAKELSSDEQSAQSQALWAETLERFENDVALRAVDERTLQMTLVSPTPYWLDLCAFAVFSPVYEPLVSQYESVLPATGLLKLRLGWTKPPLLVTNGPFMLESWRFKRDMFLRANENWWNRDSLHVDTIAIPSVEDPNAAVLAFETGSADWVSDVTVDYRRQLYIDKNAFRAEHAETVSRLRSEGLDEFAIDAALPADSRKNFHVLPNMGVYWYNFNCLPNLPDGRPNPFHDARVRRAFAMTIDKQQITEDVMRIGNPVARTLVPPGSIPGYKLPAGLKSVGDAETESERQAIIDEALELLASAGYPDPSNFPTVEILFNKDSGHDLIAQSVMKDWQRHLGVPITLAVKEIKVFADDLKKANYMVSRAGWFADYADPTTFLDLLKTGNGNNDRKYSSERYDSLLKEAAVELDAEKRFALLSEAERIIMEEDLPMVPLFYYVSPYLFDAARVTGMNPHPRAQQDIYLVDVLGDGKGADQVIPIRTGDDYEKGLLEPGATR